MKTAAYGATLLRMSLGIIMLAHAYLKFGVFGLEGTAGFFAANGFPAWTAWPVAFAELGGGLLLVLGVHTRLVALGLVPILLGAIATHWNAGFYFTSSGGGWEFPALLLVLVGVQALVGDGAFALRLPTVLDPVQWFRAPAHR
ncbi:MAG TPA: DoxX family protein [Myxococcaceae bacterium]